MSDREALEAALERVGANWRSEFLTIITAAQERLAQLPQVCGHTDHDARFKGCNGRLYPRPNGGTRSGGGMGKTAPPFLLVYCARLTCGHEWADHRCTVRGCDCEIFLPADQVGEPE